MQLGRHTQCWVCTPNINEKQINIKAKMRINIVTYVTRYACHKSQMAGLNWCKIPNAK